MNKIKYLAGKLKEHHEDLGTLRTIRWLLFAVRFRAQILITRGGAYIRGEGNIKRKKSDPNLLLKNGLFSWF